MLHICVDKIIIDTRQQFSIKPQEALAWRAEWLRKGRSDVMPSGSEDFGHCWSQCVLLPLQERTRTIAASCQRLIIGCIVTVVFQRLHLDACSKLACCVFGAILCVVPSLFGYTNLSEWESWIERQQNRCFQNNTRWKCENNSFFFWDARLFLQGYPWLKCSSSHLVLKARSARSSVLYVITGARNNQLNIRCFTFTDKNGICSRNDGGSKRPKREAPGVQHVPGDAGDVQQQS